MDQSRVNIYIGASSIRTCLGNKTETLVGMHNNIEGLKYSDSYAMYAGIAEVKIIKGLSRFESLVIEQIQNVIDESAIKLSDKDTQLIICTTKGNINFLADDCKEIPNKVFLDASAKVIAERIGCSNTPIIISNACISGVSGFVIAKWLLETKQYKNVILAGGDSLCDFITSGFASFKSISPQPCKPYDENRDGLTLGEAAGAILLTTDVLLSDEFRFCLTGGVITNDANHISGPSRTGDGLFYAINEAMQEAEIECDNVGFICTHGTATRYNDEMESKAVAWAQLDKTPLNSLKGYIGHTLGASGVVETIICIEELKQGYIFGTKGFQKSDTPHELSVSPDIQHIKNQCFVKTASGFGGCNAAIVIEQVKEKCISRNKLSQYKIIAEYTLPKSNLPFAKFIRDEYKALGESNMKFYKMSDMCKALYVSVEKLLQIQPINEIKPLRKAIILSNKSASLDADIIHQEIINQHLPEGTSPAAFVYTLPNVAAGEICIRHKIQGNNTFFVEDKYSELIEKYSMSLISQNLADVVIYGWCEYLQGNWNVKIKLLKKID